MSLLFTTHCLIFTSLEKVGYVQKFNVLARFAELKLELQSPPLGAALVQIIEGPLQLIALGLKHGFICVRWNIDRCPQKDERARERHRHLEVIPTRRFI